ncbi:MAG: glycosyltransferase [Bacteroidota bacterium]
MNDTVAAVVVTYNRKELLIECLEAIRKQTHKPDSIFIIDNKSTDGTPKLLLERNYICKLPEKDIEENQLIKHQISSLSTPNDNIQINYVRKFENDGGAGGFYEGMKRAYEAGYDWLWMMDDDGIADNNQLMELLNAPSKYKYRNALVVDINDNSKLAFGLKGYKSVSDIIEKELIEDEANPFNGTFIHRKIPERIGLIKREMFIWGDEAEYLQRTKKNKFRPTTVKSAVHYHPKMKNNTYNILGNINVTIYDYKNKTKTNCAIRNHTYNFTRYHKFKQLMIFILTQSYYNIFIKKSMQNSLLFYKAVIKGITGNFNV